MQKLLLRFCVLSISMISLGLGAVEINVPSSESRSLTSEELSLISNADELIKLGQGTLVVGSELSSFPGVIRIKEGAYSVTESGALGTVIGATYVSNGAALVLNCSTKDALTFGAEEVHIAGAGTKTYPGVISNPGSQAIYAFKTLILDDDVMLSIPETGFRFDVRDGNVDMNGKTLTISVKNINRNISFTRTNVKNSGHIIVEEGRFQIEGTNSEGFDWDGDANNTLTVRKGAYLQYSESKSRIPWTLIFEEGAKIPSLKATMLNNNQGDRWNGPIQINGRQGNTAVTGPYTDDAPLRFAGPVSGKGIFYWTRGWMMLSNPANSFTGTWSCKKDQGGAIGKVGMVIENTGSVSTITRSIVMGNGATLSLPAAEPYQLPPLEFNATIDMEVTGNPSGTAVSLIKKGSKPLVLNGNLAITGVTDIAEGVLKLANKVPYGYPGLWHGIHLCTGEGEDTAGTLLHARNLYKDNVTNSIFYAYQDRIKYDNANGTIATFSGYLWNRESTSVVWTVTMDIETGMVFYLNDLKTQQFSSQGRRFLNVTLNPGSNYVEFRLYRGDGKYVPHAHGIEQGENWPKNFGIAYAVGGGQTEPALFNKFEDPGDGSLLTCDLTPRTELDVNPYRVKLDNIKLSGGVLDLNDRDITMSSKMLSGYGIISNGVLKLTKSWEILRDDLALGGVKFCNADVSFGADFAFETSSLIRSQVSDEGIVIAMFENGTIKDFNDWTSSDGWFKIVKTNAGELKLFKVQQPLKIIIR